ncbi:MAG: phosphoribosyltransferase [Acaryochloridaceae cyanobacterium RL_2_7]|nr:phosphoribosyltransferase [Acaryochloridaceae cyanobacterium RL_2_7]
MAATDLFVSWSEYHQLIEGLAVQIYESGWSFQSILCLARGGLRVGDVLSRIFDVPLAVLAASSYGGDRQRGKVSFSEQLTMARPPLIPNVLIVDDLVDSGMTLAATIPWIQKYHRIEPQHCRTAVLWYKYSSCIKPNYYVSDLPDNPWIHQPFEAYETQPLQDLMSRFKHQDSMLCQ